MTLLLLIATLNAPLGSTDAPRVPGAIAMEDPGRYRSPRGYDDTIEYYKRVFRSQGGVRWRNIINLPGIRAKHLQNLRSRSNWEGINIYEHRGETYFYIIAKTPRRK